MDSAGPPSASQPPAQPEQNTDREGVKKLRLAEHFFPRLPQSPGPYNVGTLDFELPAKKPRSFGEYGKWRSKKEVQLDLTTSAFILYYPTRVGGVEAQKAYFRPRWIHQPVWSFAQAYVQSCAVPKPFSWVFSSLILLFIFGVRLMAFEGAPLARFAARSGSTSHEEKDKIPERLPVIIFSHGLTGTPRIYSEICGAWASYGFFVCSIEHRDGTGPLVLVSPEKVPSQYQEKYRAQFSKAYPRINGRHYPRYKVPWVKPDKILFEGKHAPDWMDPDDKTLKLRRGQLRMRMAEIEECMTYLHELNDGKLGHKALAYLRDGKGRLRSVEEQKDCLQQFRCRLDLTGNISIAGHSFGGATAIEMLRLRKRSEKSSDNAQGEQEGLECKYPFKLGILLDPWSSPLPPPDKQFLPSDFSAPLHPVASDDGSTERAPRGSLKVPLLSINSTMFSNWDDVSPYTKAVVQEAAEQSGRGVSLEIRGSVHLSQSDVPVLFNRTLLRLPISALKLDATRCLELNIEASLEFLRLVLPLDGEGAEMPLPASGTSRQLGGKGLRSKWGEWKRGDKERKIQRRDEHVLNGEAEEVVIQFKKL